jgi:hypothetical protein
MSNEIADLLPYSVLNYAAARKLILRLRHCPDWNACKIFLIKRKNVQKTPAKFVSSTADREPIRPFALQTKGNFDTRTVP